MQEIFGVRAARGANRRRLDRAARQVLRAVLLLFLVSTASATLAEEPQPEPASPSEEADAEGMVVRMGPVTASFRFFGDVGAHYDSTINSATGSKANFLAGTFDFFAAARLTEHLQMLSEVVAEFEDDTNEVGFELERFWASWSKHDAFYVKLGREHAPVSHWNRRYHHGRVFWPAVTQPFLARFEDQGGPLPIHHSGVEFGGTLHTRAGALSYLSAISNGRGVDSTEVTNVADRDDTKAWDVGGSFAPAALPGLLLGLNYRDDRIPADPTNPLAGKTNEVIATAFAELRAERWEAITEIASINHEPAAAGPEFKHSSGYLQVNYALDRFTPYARVDVRKMDLGDPFYLPHNLDLDQWDGLVGVRFDLGDQAALKIEAGAGRSETRDAVGVVSKDNLTFAALGLQWVF